MKSKLAALALAFAFTPAAFGQFTVTLSHVHLCCTSCVKGVDRATAYISGVAAKSDSDTGTVIITAPDKATVHGRLQTARQSTGVTATRVCPPSRRRA